MPAESSNTIHPKGSPDPVIEIQSEPRPESPQPKRPLSTVSITLPSGGVADIREVSGAEERILANEKLQRKGEAFDLWLSSAIVTLNGKADVTPADTLALLAGDRMYLIVRIIELSYGDSVDFDSTCPRCDHVSQSSISISETILPTLKPYPEKREFEFVLPSGRKIIYGYTTGMHERAMAAKDDPSPMDLLAMRVRSVDGFPATPQTLDEFDGRDRATLRRKLMSDPGGGVSTAVDVTCEACKHRYVTHLQDHVSFFLPGLRQR